MYILSIFLPAWNTFQSEETSYFPVYALIFLFILCKNCLFTVNRTAFTLIVSVYLIQFYIILYNIKWF